MKTDPKFNFIQEGPSLTNQFDDDLLLQNYLRQKLPENMQEIVFNDLKSLGQRVTTDILNMARDAEAHEPVLAPYSPWGLPVDKIHVAKGWRDLETVSAQEGMVAIGYERNYSEFSRIYQFSKLYLFNPSSAYYTCPLAMSDGAARVLELFGSEEQKNRGLRHLTSRDPKLFWTSGQWMTEQTGGSDVSRTQTLAEYKDGHYFLTGLKWFTSSPISQMAMALARIVDSNGQSISGSRGLSLFYLETYNPDGSYNNFEILRLKNKLGTRALPTAEIRLEGSKAELIGKIGEGVKTISNLFNITRLYNANTSIASSRRVIALAKNYALKREAYGKKIAFHPLHSRTLSECENLWTGCFLFSFYTTELLGKEECGKATEQEATLLRLFTPLVKLYTAKCNLLLVSELLESFGGAGYIEDVGIAKWLRDSQVLTIWEGTTNILSLDMLRAIVKESAWDCFCDSYESEISTLNSESLTEKWDYTKNEIQDIFKQPSEVIESNCRFIAMALSEIICHWLVEKSANWLPRSSEVLAYWRKRPISKHII